MIEGWGFETLREDVSTSAENESSVVLYGQIGSDSAFLLTGDAGVEALRATADWAESKGLSLPQILKFVQMPHHGSRNNVSPGVLDRILGPRLSDPGQFSKNAFVSVGAGSSTHPRKAVVNAFYTAGRKGISNERLQDLALG
jgi:beta-lactamase superfamily II metal-dependent hydrolase